MKNLGWKTAPLVLFLSMALVLSGCGTTRYAAESWKLPERKNPQSAIIFGRIEMPSNKQENPDGLVLRLNDVNFQRPGHVYFHAGNIPRGEDNYVMTNKYFVIPDIPPGKYYFAGFTTGNVYNSLPYDKDKLIDVKPGQLLFIGSYDYLDGPRSGLREAFGIPGSYSLRPTKSPTELEMLQWLSRAAVGSGWEAAINKRIHALGGKASPKVSTIATRKNPG
jgi:hypothetical protein